MQVMATSIRQSPSLPTPTLFLNATNYSGSGSTWTATNGSSATLFNTPTYVSASPTYFNFSPTSLKYATVPNIGSLSNWTVEAWFRLTSSLSGYVTSVVCNQFNLSTSLNFSIGTNNSPANYNLCVGFYDGSWRTTSGFSPSTNIWYHIVGTYDGNTVNQYVNGTINTFLNYTGTPTSGGEVRIARRWDEPASVSSNMFPGDIGLVRIWNSALSAAQVSTLYAQNSSRFV